jgi:hypothetical protein
MHPHNPKAKVATCAISVVLPLLCLLASGCSAARLGAQAQNKGKAKGKSPTTPPWSKHGYLTPGSLYSYDKNGTGNNLDYVNGLQGRKFKIVTVVEEPFVMLTDASVEATSVQPNFQGILIDLLHGVSNNLHFDYDLVLPKNGNTHAAAMDMLVNGEVDMIWAHTTITPYRSYYADWIVYSEPYYVLFVENMEMDPPASFFKFLRPFSNELWLTLLLMTTISGLIYYALESGWPVNFKSHEDKEPENESASIINSILANTLSLATGSGGNLEPQTPTGQFYLVFWSFFILITVAAYTAEMASYLTTQKLNKSIRSIDDLVSKGGSACVRYNSDELRVVSTLYPSLGTSVLFQSSYQVVEGIALGQCQGVVLDMTIGAYQIGKKEFCNLKASEHRFWREEVAVGLSHNLDEYIFPVLSHEIFKYRDQGFFDLATKKWVTDHDRCGRNLPSLQRTTATREVGSSLADFQGLFGIFFLVCALLTSIKVFGDLRVL